ncbi:MAG: ATP-binding protein [Candidatus Methanospirareceae archaeon]
MLSTSGGLPSSSSTYNKSKETIYKDFDKKQHAKMHLSALFSMYSDGFIELRFIEKRAKSEFFHISEIDKAAEAAIKKSEAVYDVYVGVFPRKQKKQKGGGRKEDVVDEVYFLFIDIDDKKTMKEEELAEFLKGAEIRQKDDILERIIFVKNSRTYISYKKDNNYVVCDVTLPDPRDIEQKLGLKPYLVVYSGGGYHIYFRLSDPIPKEEAAQLLKSLVRKANKVGIPADPKSADIARILRVAGTVNMKNCMITEIKYYCPDAVNDVDEVRQALKIEEQAAEAVEQRETAEEKETSGKFRELKESQKHSIVEAFLKVWRTGARHNLTMFLAGSLAWRKVDPDICFEIVQRICKSSGDPELSDRLRAVADTYLAMYKDDEEKKEYILTVAKKYGVSASQRNVNIASKQYLEKALESGDITETEAEELLSVINETLSITPPGFSFWTLISRKRQQYIVNDLRAKEIADGYKGEDGRIQKDRRIIAAALQDLRVIDDIATSERYYVATFVTKKETFTVTCRDVDEIVAHLRRRALVVSQARAEDALSALISAMINYDRAKKEKTATRRGFFIDDDRIIANGIETDFDEEKLREAVIFLRNIVEDWFSSSKEQAATIIRWFMVAPFSYIFKKLGKQPIPWLYLYGPSSTGKTTLCRIGAALWSENNCIFTNGSSMNSEFRLSRYLALSSFPLVVNEAEKIVDPMKSRVYDIVKDAVESLIARIRGKPSGDEEIYYSFAPLAMTSNNYLPSDPAFERRFIYITFSWKQRIDLSARQIFRQQVLQNLHRLHEIGKFIAYAVTEYPELIFRAENYEELSEEIIKRLEAATGVDLSFLREKYIYEEETAEDAIVEEIREAIFTELQEIARRFSLAWPPSNDDEITAESILRSVAEHTPWLYVRGGKVFIATPKFFEKIGGLRGFAEAMNAEYKVVKFGGKARRAVVMHVIDFVNFICPRLEETEEDEGSSKEKQEEQKEEHEEKQEQKEETEKKEHEVEEGKTEEQEEKEDEETTEEDIIYIDIDEEWTAAEGWIDEDQ